MISEMSHKERAVVEAVLYALRQGCFFPVPEPRPGATLEALRQWGALRQLHATVADLTKGA